MSPKEKLIYLGAIPLLAAGIGGTATFLVAQNDREPIVIGREAVEAAKDGKITIEIVRKDETDSSWPIAFGVFAVAAFFAAFAWAMTRD
ncbi:hypothetical protein WBQ88_09415 [Sphingopyxis sp. CCNWLW253]|uniref:hypothetical protein n=1 Tax=unclassified Sphingopyxis TaxID=2614943 RepID=UPI0030129E4C